MYTYIYGTEISRVCVLNKRSKELEEFIVKWRV